MLWFFLFYCSTPEERIHATSVQKTKEQSITAKSVLGTIKTDEETHWRLQHRWVLTTSPSYREGFLDISISKDTLQHAIDNYGIPAEMETIEYIDNQDLQNQIKRRESYFTQRGMEQVLIGETVMIRTSLSELVKMSHTSILPLQKQLLALQSEKIQTLRSKIEILASYVQSFQIEIPPRYKENSRGDSLLVAGVRVPLETALMGKGDCDSLSVLFASLLYQQDAIQLVFLRGHVDGNPHVLVGVHLSLQEGDLYIQYKEQNFVLFDLTVQSVHGWKENVRKMLKDQEFEIVEI